MDSKDTFTRDDLDAKSRAQHLWLDRATGEVADDSTIDKAILPIGACEYHGAHLPYGTDTIAAETLATAMAQRLKGSIVLPTIPYGVSTHHLMWKWTMSIGPHTLINIIEDIGESLAAHDIKKLVLLVCHDGNPAPASAAARVLSHKYDITTALFSGWQKKARALLAPEWDIDPDHGGQSETSMVLYGAPGTAKMEKGHDLTGSTPEKPMELMGRYIHDRPHGYSGNVPAATAEEGKAAVDALMDDVIPFLEELDANGWQRGAWIRGE